MLVNKSAEERLCVQPSHVISPRLGMLLWREINVNTSHCEKTLVIRFKLFEFYEWLF